MSALMYLKASGCVTPAGKNSTSEAMRLGSDANLMNSRQAAALGVPARIDHVSQPQRFWFHTMVTGAPSAIAACGRDTQVPIMSTSPDLSICSTCAPVFHQTSILDLILSKLAKARSTFKGYSDAVGTPPAMSDSSSVSLGFLRS